MKNKKITSVAALLIASLSAVQAVTITDWDFDIVGAVAAPDNNPASSAGTGVANALGMNNSYNNTNSISAPDVLASSGASTGTGSYGWRVRGAGASPNSGNGWSTQAPIGTQGAEFDASTLGFNSIQISFDIDTTAQAERNLQLEYTLDGSTWQNATLTLAGSLGTLANNSSSANTVTGSYDKLGSGWNNGITASLTGITGANDDASFGIRIVNASTGADDVNVSGAALNNTSGNWRYDNVLISGVADVPEPTTLALTGLGLAGLIACRKRS